MTLNEFAADWWAKEFLIEEKRELLRQELLKRLPDKDWSTYVDYDPQGVLLEAIQAIHECRGCMFSAQGIFRGGKFGLRREGNQILRKDGYGQPWEEIYREE